MKLEMQRDTLLVALQAVSKAINKTALPILQGIYVEVTNEEIIIKASDNTDTLVHLIPVDNEGVTVSSTGKTVFPKNIVDIVKRAGKTVEISSEDNGLITKVKSGKKIDFDMNCMDPLEYPELPIKDLSQPTFSVSGEQFRDLARKSVFATSESQTRPILTGVCLTVKGDCIELVATDSHRLSKLNLSVTTSNKEEMSIVIPKGTWDKGLKSFDLSKNVEFFVHELSVVMRNGQTVFNSRLLDGNFPDTSRLIPTDHKQKMTIDRKELISGLEFINGVVDDKKTASTKLHINGVASLSPSTAQSGKGNFDIFYDMFEGEDEFDINFSVRYCLEALQSIDTDTVDIHFEGPMRPFVINPVYDDISHSSKELQLILPVRAS
ncbi:DNA polymerase III subunit beta [Bacillus sp. AFS040349]|uniref:DNA polymerase III subunit beta n=1 Tax=Bacillus sp. AFS040349 TaxID=2033502 RepID=UPI00159BE9A2|nr:DNA polymerase III subunit beta [Bacillus sp. AFS040349]